MEEKFIELSEKEDTLELPTQAMLSGFGLMNLPINGKTMNLKLAN